MKRNHWALLGATIFLFFIVVPSHSPTFGYMGPYWLIPLYLIAFYLIIRTLKKVSKVWRNPSEEIAFASLPIDLQIDPKKCHRYFVAVLIGLGCLIWTAFVTPLWVKPFNQIGRIANVPFGSRPSWAPLVEGIAVSTGITLYLGILILLGAYIGAGSTAKRLRRTEAKPSSSTS